MGGTGRSQESSRSQAAVTWVELGCFAFPYNELGCSEFRLLTPMVPGWAPRSRAANWVVLRSVSSSFGCQNLFENRFKKETQKVKTSHAEL